MQKYIERMIEEKKELAGRINRASKAVENPPFGSDKPDFNYEILTNNKENYAIHTYVCDGNPIPTFQGEPERVAIPNDIDAFTDSLWEALDADNKISLYVKYIDLATGEAEERLINKNR